MKGKKAVKIILKILCLGIVLWLVKYGGLNFQDEDIIKYEGDKIIDAI